MTVMDTHPASVEGAAVEGARAGLSIVAVAEDGSKRPAGEWKTWQSRRRTEDEVTALFGPSSRGLGVVCGAVSDGLEMFEFEGRAVQAGIGGEFKARCEAAGLGSLWGRITGGYLEETPGGGAHVLYRTDKVGGNEKLARRVADGGEIEVLIETRGEGGFVVTAPSGGTVHDTGRSWKLLSGSFSTIATITTAERDQLFTVARTFDTMPMQEMSSPPRVASSDDDNLAPGTDYNLRGPEWAAILEPHGWAPLSTDAEGSTLWRRPGKTTGISASTNHAGSSFLYVWSTSTPFETERGVSKFAAYTILNHGGAFPAAAKALRDQGFGTSRSEANRNNIVSIIGHRPVALATPPILTDERIAPEGPPALPEEFWAQRPELEHIRTAARSGMLGPDAFLLATIGHVALLLDYRFVIQNVIGGYAEVNPQFGFVGPPGDGKSATTEGAGQMIDAPSDSLGYRTGVIPAGSGEGMVRAFSKQISAGKGQPKEWVRQYEGLFISVDEVSALKSLGERSGQTTGPTLRSAHSGKTLGASYVNSPIIQAHTYRLVIALCVQPELIGFLFDSAEIAAGTPQRYIWAATADADSPEVDDIPAHPGPLLWTPPSITDPKLEPLAKIIPRIGRRWVLPVEPSVAREIKQARRDRLQGQGQDLDAHRGLNRLMIGNCLATLNGHLGVTRDDWTLATAITDNSTAVTAWMRGRAAAMEERKVEAGHRRSADRAGFEIVGRAAATGGLERAARTIARHVHRGTCDGGCRRRCLSQAVAGKERRIVADELGGGGGNWLEAAIGVAVGKLWVTENGDSGIVSPGESAVAA